MWRKTWFGVPRFVYFAAVAGLIAAVVIWKPAGSPSPRVSAAVEGLRSSSVYVESGAPGYVDPERAKAVLGDRPIVVAIMNEVPPPAREHVNGPAAAMCEDIARLVPTNLVILFSIEKDGYGSSYCDGDDFPGADGLGFSFNVIVEAEIGWKYRATKENLTPEIEEYVLAFDAQAAEEFKDGIPVRGAVPDELAKGQIALAMIGMVLGTVALFVLLRVVGLAIKHGRHSAADLRRRRTAAGARLNRVAEAVLRPGPADDLDEAHHQAHVAKRYLYTLHQFEEADTAAKLTRAEQEIAELEREVVGA
jgi:hypothetical protein